MKKKSIIWVTIISIVIALAILIWRYFGLAIIVMIGDMNVPDKNGIIELVNENQIEITNAIDVKENIEYPKGETLQQDGKGYSWDEPDGDNRFYVEKIIDGFFYYESHY